MKRIADDTSDVQPSTCDVAVIGGGLVGASLACALAPLGLKVALLEAQEPLAAVAASFDNRALALSESSCRIFRGIGIWPLLENAATPIREIRVSERKGRPPIGSATCFSATYSRRVVFSSRARWTAD